MCSALGRETCRACVHFCVWVSVRASPVMRVNVHTRAVYITGSQQFLCRIVTLYSFPRAPTRRRRVRSGARRARSIAYIGVGRCAVADRMSVRYCIYRTVYMYLHNTALWHIWIWHLRYRRARRRANYKD